MTTVATAVAGSVATVTGLAPGEPITSTLGTVWSAHVEAHLERCGAVHGPLATWVCRQGHPLYQ